MSEATELILWSDRSPHYLSYEFLWGVFKRIRTKFNVKVSLNYFAEKHGKSALDGHFGQISRFIKAHELIDRVWTTGDVHRAVVTGQAKSNKKRKKRGLPPTNVHVISHEFTSQATPSSMQLKLQTGMLSTLYHFGWDENELYSCVYSDLSVKHRLQFSERSDGKVKKRRTSGPYNPPKKGINEQSFEFEYVKHPDA